MKFQYPTWLVIFTPAIASPFPISIFLDDKMKSISESAWFALSCFGLIIFAMTVYIWKYSITVNGDDIYVSSIRRRHFQTSRISSVNVVSFWHGKSAVIAFESGENLSVPGGLQDFEKLIQLLKLKRPEAQLLNTSFP